MTVCLHEEEQLQAVSCCASYIAASHVAVLGQAEQPFIQLLGRSPQPMTKLPLQVSAAAAEAEPADAEADAVDAAESEAEENNGDGVIETGSELGSVQTPASVWLPFETSTPGGKVMDRQKQTMRCSSNLWPQRG